MSFLGKIFGTGKKGDAAPTTGEAIQKLRETEEMLMKKQEFLEKKIDQELDIARKNAKTNKRSAIQVSDPKFWFFFNNRKNYPFLMSFAFESYLRSFLKAIYGLRPLQIRFSSENLPAIIKQRSILTFF